MARGIGDKRSRPGFMAFAELHGFRNLHVNNCVFHTLEGRARGYDRDLT